MRPRFAASLGMMRRWTWIIACAAVSVAAGEHPDDERFVAEHMQAALVTFFTDHPDAERLRHRPVAPHSANEFVGRCITDAALASARRICGSGNTTCWTVEYAVVELYVECSWEGSRMFGTRQLRRRIRSDTVLRLTDPQGRIRTARRLSLTASDALPSDSAETTSRPHAVPRREITDRPILFQGVAALAALASFLLLFF